MTKSISGMYTHLCMHLCITEYRNQLGKSKTRKLSLYYEVSYTSLCYRGQTLAKPIKAKHIQVTQTFHSLFTNWQLTCRKHSHFTFLTWLIDTSLSLWDVRSYFQDDFGGKGVIHLTAAVSNSTERWWHVGILRPIPHQTKTNPLD